MKFPAVVSGFMAVFLVFLLPLPLWAEETSTEPIRMEEIKVTASPIVEGSSVDRYAAPKTTVSSEQIEDLNAQDLTTALRMAPGVNISRFNSVGAFGGGEGGGIFIRGMGSSRPGAEIKTYVDGVPMYMSVWNHPLLDLLPVDPTGAIEIFKSPQPQYFGNAMAAIDLAPKRKRTQGTESKLTLSGGSYDTVIGQAETAGKRDRLDYYIGGAWRQSDGHRDNAEGRTANVYGRFGYRVSDVWDLYFFGLHTDNEAEDPGEKGADPALRQGTYETRSYLTSLTLSNRYASAEGFVKIYRNAGEGDWLDQPTETEGVFEDLFNDFRYYGIKIRETFTPFDGAEWTAGFDWENTQGDYTAEFSDGTTDRWEGHDYDIASPYAAISQRFGDDNGLYFIPSGGARFYEHSDFDGEWAPHAGIVIGRGSLEWYAGYSRGVVYPGLDVVVFSEKVIPMLADSWKDLEPETMDHYETGISWMPAAKARVNLSWFYNEGKNRYVIVPPPPPPPIYDNIGEYTIRGAEAEVQFYPMSELTVFAGGTWMDTDPSDLPYAPEITLSAGLNWGFRKGWALNLDGKYLDDMFVSSQARRAGAENQSTVDSYFLLNGKISRSFEIASTNVTGEVFVAGENLTDTNYQYLPGYPMPGINGMAGVTFIY